MAGDQSEPLGIVQPLGKGLGSAQVVQDPRMFIERLQDMAQVEPQINGLYQCVAAFGDQWGW